MNDWTRYPRRPRRRAKELLFLCMCAVLLGGVWCGAAQQPTDWPAYGGDAGGQRYAAAEQITPANVRQLRQVWRFATHALQGRDRQAAKASFEATPVLLGRTLLLTTPFDEVLALDAATGALQWRYDPHLSADLDAAIYTSRGVAVWGAAKAGEACGQRVFLGTLDARLIALDAASGQVCGGFGQGGTVDLKRGLATQHEQPYAGYGVTSPPTVVGNVVVVGSSVSDNQAVDVEPGVVRGYDARDGRLLWTWDPLAALNRGARVRTGAGNTWGVMAADEAHGIVYLPTGSASPDFYGGERLGDDRDADSLVALEAATGRKLWSFQTVHHNLWDYDIAAQPLLFTLHGNVPAVAVTTKTGMIFVLNRLTGEVLSPAHEAPVPQTAVRGERTSPMQPVSDLPSLAPLGFVPRPPGEGTATGDRECAAMLHGLRYEGLYTPPSTGGTLLFPGSLGGVNWGSAAFDPETGILYANTNRLPFEVRLIPHWKGVAEQIAHDPPWYYGVGSAVLALGGLLWWRRGRSALPLLTVLLGACVVGVGVWMEGHPLLGSGSGSHAHFGQELSEQRGTPFWIFRKPLADSEGLPCVAAPWGALTGVDLEHGQRVFERPVGTMVPGKETGTSGLGGPVVTRGGLVFTAASREPYLRAFDKRSGAELWRGKLPVPAQATPMVFTLEGREYVVICAGGHGAFGTETGDTVLAFALPMEAGRRS